MQRRHFLTNTMTLPIAVLPGVGHSSDMTAATPFTNPQRLLLTQNDAFDLLTGGLAPGELVSVVARPLNGRTTLALSLSQWITLNNVGDVLYFRGRNRFDDLSCRLPGMASQLIDTKSTDSPAQLEYLESQAVGGILVSDAKWGTRSEIWRDYETLQALPGIDIRLIIVDDCLPIPLYGRNVVPDLLNYRRLAQQIQTPIVLLHGVPREVIDESGYPGKAYFSAVAPLTEVVDRVLIIHRRELYDPRPCLRNLVELYALPSGRIALTTFDNKSVEILGFPPDDEQLREIEENGGLEFA